MESQRLFQGRKTDWNEGRGHSHQKEKENSSDLQIIKQLESIVSVLSSPAVSNLTKLKLIERLRLLSPLSKQSTKTPILDRNTFRKSISPPPSYKKSSLPALPRPTTQHQTVSEVALLALSSEIKPSESTRLWFRALCGCLNSYDTSVVAAACQAAVDVFESCRRDAFLLKQNLFCALETGTIDKLIETFGHPHNSARDAALRTMTDLFSAMVRYL